MKTVLLFSFLTCAAYADTNSFNPTQDDPLAPPALNPHGYTHKHVKGEEVPHYGIADTNSSLSK